ETMCREGTCSATSPGRFSPPVSSESTSHGSQPSADHASQTSGGCRGSTPTPSTWLLSRSTATHEGTGADSPKYSASPGAGFGEKAATSLPSSTSTVRSVGLAPLFCTTTAL